MSGENLERIILGMPRQFLESFQAAARYEIVGDFSEVIICGMGGSALAGDLLKIFLEELEIKIPIHLVRDYSLHSLTPATALVIAVSYSGNTEETLSVFEQARKRNIQTIAVSKNGGLEKLAEKYGAIFIRLPDFKTEPRFATLGILGAIIRVLMASGIASPKTAATWVKTLGEIDIRATQNIAKDLAKKIFKKINLIYTSYQYRAVGFNLKLKFNETVQIPAFSNYFSELNHNEIASIGNHELTKNFFATIIKFKKDSPRMEQRMLMTSELLKKYGVGNEIIKPPGKNEIEEVFHTIFLGDWLSLFLAQYYGVDPTSSATIEEFKKRLG
ncbi:bifunctional phosphoglucose/phosphomannose isomerase [Candidatus Parcubacteria bacterium]|nr:MAG: bifunctional phosphoglucose/phosphomannose isomerase [Candidatus Parcubacteria bacterium]